MKQLGLAILIFAAAPSIASADDVYGDPNDPGKVTAVNKGVKEIDLGGLAVLSRDQEGEMSVTRLSTDWSASFSYYLKRNLSIGVAGLFDYENSGGGVRATTFGGAAQATLHARLGLGAFFRPGISVGAMFGSRKSPTGTAGMLAEASQVGMITRIQLPIAYFTSRRFLLQAGPQLNVTVGSYTPTGGTAQSFVRVAGGFAVGIGYIF